jgi:hypothetical protein
MRALLAIVIVCAAATTAQAHKPSDAHLTLAVEHGRVTGRLDIAVRDLDVALGIDDGDGAITWRELEASRERIARYITDRLALADNRGVRCPIVLGAPALVDLSDGTYWTQPFDARCASAVTSLRVTYALLFDVDAQHRGLIHVGDRVLISRDAAPLTIELGTTTSISELVHEGMRHIWLGIDHLLFLLCLLLPAAASRRAGTSRPASSLRVVALDVLQVVTAFTIAHSLTLAAATLGMLHLPSRFVETAIALSIVIAAANNLVRAVDTRWAVAFALGLLHGFGFSSVLLDLGLTSRELIIPLLSFNLGVELGQIAFVAVVLPVLYAVRRTFVYPVLLWAGSTVAASIGLLWTYERLLR